MSYNNRNLGPLSARFPANGLFAAWLDGRTVPGSKSAAVDLAAALDAPTPATPAPLWQEASFAGLLPENCRDLPQGPGVVVTGQQPGFLGGPLLTLHKIATAIALAARRTAAGKPTVPVFWSGDDDDDLAEALAPVGWHAGNSKLLRSTDRERLRNPATQRAILAELGPELWAAPARDHLLSGKAGGALPDDLIDLLTEAVAGKETWGTGQAALIRQIFAGTGLVVIRGHDPRLHEIAAPFYAQISGRLEELAGLVRTRGAALATAGFQAQISDRSLQRPLFRIEEGRRVAVAGFAADDVRHLRPGVMLRSPLQDWLLQPAGVVIGPGELAYLRQLDPLYAALDLPRSALVPRLSGWVVPAGADGEELLTSVRPNGAAEANGQAARAGVWADQVVDAARERMTGLLADELGLSAERAASLAGSRARRFRKGVVAMFGAELARQEDERLAGIPQWLLPGGQSQERGFGLLSALNLWGGELVTAILAAADQHLENGRRGSWQEVAITVSEGTVSK